jgi:hypothetical protein
VHILGNFIFGVVFVVCFGFLFLVGNTFFVDGNTYILVTLFLILVTLKVGEEENAHTRRLPNIVRYHTRLHHNNNILGHLS